MNNMNVALVIDDTVEVPPKNGVTSRFYNSAKYLLQYPGIHVFIADRGGTEIAKMAKDGFHATIFPSSWLYREDKFPEIVALFKEKDIRVWTQYLSHNLIENRCTAAR